MNGCSTHSIWLICPSSLAAFQWGVLATLNALLLLEIMDKPSVIWFTALSGPTRITRLQILSRRNGAPPFSVKTEESDPPTRIPFAVHLGFQEVFEGSARSVAHQVPFGDELAAPHVFDMGH
jgi:hypothetical protein